MLIKRRHGWEIPESRATPEAVFLDRRSLLTGLAGMTLAGLAGPAHAETDPSLGLYPSPPNPAFKDAGRAVTNEKYNINYNNFYEFGTSKSIAAEAEKLRIRPWQIAIDGEVEKPFVIGIDDLLKKVALEERVYRHRCVEAWSMVVPWSGFPMKTLVELAKPKADAKYVRFETFNDPEMASGQQPGLFGTMPWPYIEGLTMAEATHDLAFVVTGAYGKPVAKSMGAPIRIHVPWKYGFKSIKSIIKVSFVKERPVGMWEQLQAFEYGFWANVNPDVPHPRWSQATEQVLGTGERVPTRIYNGYGAFVAPLYAGLEGEKLFM
ncbi:MAG: protein-methionine-sulfoxide reductase catalytic subunit MsrP [Parvibaculaceae bacterium]